MEFNTITESLEKINSNKISIVELNDIFINRIKKNKNLNAFIYFDEENISQQIKNIQSSKNNFKGAPDTPGRNFLAEISAKTRFSA